MWHKQFLKTYIITLSINIIIIGLLNYICDPLQFYRYSEKKSLNSNARLQMAGILRSFDYNQIILGTSMTQNFSQKLIQDIMGTKPVRLSLAGSTIQEQLIVLKGALAQKKLKSVIWGLDRGYLDYKKGILSPSFPYNLYQQNMLGSFSYLLNVNVTYASIKALNPWRKPKLTALDLDKYEMWHDRFTYSKELILKLYSNATQHTKQQDISEIKTHFSENALHAMVAMKIENFNNDVMSLIKAHPEVHFDIFCPPYSLAQYKITYLNDPMAYAAEAYLRHYIYQQLIALSNVAVHDFEVNLEIIANLNNYKDLVHYSKYVNNLMVYKINNKSNVLTLDNLPTNHATFIKLPLQSFL